jgi:hypothetical protein
LEICPPMPIFLVPTSSSPAIYNSK